MAHTTPHDLMNTHKMEIHMQLDGAHGETVVAHLKSTMSMMTDNSGCSLLDTICGRDTGFGQPPLHLCGYEGLHLWHTETVPLVDANDVVQQPAAAAPQLQPMMTRYEAYMLVPIRPGGQPPYMTAAEVIRQNMTKYTFFEAAQQVGAGNQPTAAAGVAQNKLIDEQNMRNARMKKAAGVIQNLIAPGSPLRQKYIGTKNVQGVEVPWLFDGKMMYDDITNLLLRAPDKARVFAIQASIRSDGRRYRRHVCGYRQISYRRWVMHVAVLLHET